MNEIEAGVKREQEIEAQLAEMDQGEQKSADPLKGKPDKKAAKGGDKKSPEEILKEELDAIRQIKLKGWILLDFPKTLSQMKLLECALSGYESKTDIPKDEVLMVTEAWNMIASPA